MADVGTIIEEIRPWVGTGGVMGLCAFATRLWITNRKLKIDENKDDRDGYGVLIATMQEAIKTMEARHSDEMRVLREDHAHALERIELEHRKCEERLSRIEGELMGFHRQALIQSQGGVAMLPASPMVQDAGKRAVEASRGRE